MWFPGKGLGRAGLAAGVGVGGGVPPLQQLTAKQTLDAVFFLPSFIEVRILSGFLSVSINSY